MSATDAYADLRRSGRPVLTTREAATHLEKSSSNTSHLLRSLQQAGLTQKLRRGLWALEPNVDPFVVTPYLTAPYPAYVSLWSALSRHGIIEQIPRQVSVASLDRTQKIPTEIGTFQVHQLAPEVFGGFEGSDTEGYVATPEKALFDTVYVRGARGQQRYFPELELPPVSTRRSFGGGLSGSTTHASAP